MGPSIIWSDPLPKILLKKYRLSRKIPNYLNDDKHKQRLELDKKFIMLTKNINIKYHSPMRIFCKKGKCLTKVYCSRKCQRKDWKRGHKEECKGMKESKI